MFHVSPVYSMIPAIHDDETICKLKDEKIDSNMHASEGKKLLLKRLQIQVREDHLLKTTDPIHHKM